LSGALGRILFVKGAIQVLWYWYWYCCKNTRSTSYTIHRRPMGCQRDSSHLTPQPFDQLTVTESCTSLTLKLTSGKFPKQQETISIFQFILRQKPQ